MTAALRSFYAVLANTLVANVTTSFLWFCLTFWVYLETRSVVATAMIGGAYMLFTSVLAIPFGTFIDHHRKKYVMQLATFAALACFCVGGALYVLVPHDALLALTQPWFWLFIIILLMGSVAESARNIALSTVVTILVPKDRRDKANGLVGMVTGISFMITSVFSGLTIGFFGMGWALVLAVVLMLVAAFHLLFVHIPEDVIVHETDATKKIDIRGSVAAIKAVPGLAGLIFFTTFNNLLGGVFMALMDAYGLSLMSVQAWGMLWGVLSTGFIVGGIVVSSRGLGTRPLRTLLLANIIMWSICILFPIRSIVPFLATGMFVYMCLMPFVEAVEQTVIQRVVPLQRQGRVFGFAQAVETLSTPVTAFLIGPIAEFVILPAMRQDGVLGRVIGGWFGTGNVRGMALLFILSGVIGLIVTIAAFRTRTYRRLTDHYAAA